MPEDINKASTGEREGSRCRLRQTTKLLPPRMNDEVAATSVGRQDHHQLRQTTVSPPTISEAELAFDDQQMIRLAIQAADPPRDLPRHPSC
jgi:hypothetical protein